MADTDTPDPKDAYLPRVAPNPLSPRASGALARPTPQPTDDSAAINRALLGQLQREEKSEQELEARRQTIETAREKEFAEEQAGMRSDLAENTRIGNRALGHFLQGQRDIPEYKPPNLSQDAFQWMSLAAAFGAIAGAFSRYHTTTALNAFAGMMNGVNKGNLQALEENYKTWQANADRALEYNNRAQREYDAIMKNSKLNLDQRAMLMKMTADKYQDQLMSMAAQERHITRMAQLMDAGVRFQENMQYRRDVLAQHHDDLLTKIDAGLATKGFKRDENNKIIPDPDNPAVLDDQAISGMVERRLLGDKSVIQNIGRGTQGAANIAKFNNRLAETMARRGVTAQDLVQLDQQFAGGQSYQVAAGRYASRVESATYELMQAIPLAEQASQGYPRENWVPWNRLLALYNSNQSDPKYNDFIIKALSARNAYVRAMNPTGNPRIAERMELQADNILSTAIGQEAFTTQLRGMWQEAENSRRAIAETRGMPAPEPRPYPTVTIGTPQVSGGGGGGPRVIHYDSEGNPVQ